VTEDSSSSSALLLLLQENFEAGCAARSSSLSVMSNRFMNFTQRNVLTDQSGADFIHSLWLLPDSSADTLI